MWHVFFPLTLSLFNLSPLLLNKIIMKWTPSHDPSITSPLKWIHAPKATRRKLMAPHCNTSLLHLCAPLVSPTASPFLFILHILLPSHLALFFLFSPPRCLIIIPPSDPNCHLLLHNRLPPPSYLLFSFPPFIKSSPCLTFLLEQCRHLPLTFHSSTSTCNHGVFCVTTKSTNPCLKINHS